MDIPVHVAITRTVRPGCEEAFEEAIRSFFSDSLRGKASLGAQFLRPLPDSNARTYGILRSFSNKKERDAFYRSEGFLRWQEAVKPLVKKVTPSKFARIGGFFQRSQPHPHPSAMEDGYPHVAGSVADRVDSLSRDGQSVDELAVLAR